MVVCSFPSVVRLVQVSLNCSTAIVRSVRGNVRQMGKMKKKEKKKGDDRYIFPDTDHKERTVNHSQNVESRRDRGLDGTIL